MEKFNIDRCRTCENGHVPNIGDTVQRRLNPSFISKECRHYIKIENTEANGLQSMSPQNTPMPHENEKIEESLPKTIKKALTQDLGENALISALMEDMKNNNN